MFMRTAIFRVLLFWSVIAFVTSGAAAWPPDPAESVVLDSGYRFKIDADWVYVNVSVRDPRNHSNILGLTKEDFLLYEDQFLRPVDSCIPAETPFNLLLLMDVSASTSPFVRILRDSALELGGQLGPADRIAIMTFSSGSRLILPPTSDRKKLKSALRLVAPDSATAFYDALISAFRTVGSIAGRKAIVVFSDGVDNQLLNPNDGSRTSFETLLDVARRSDCLIYSIFLTPATANEARHPAVLKAEQQMQILSSETGGRMYKLQKVEDLPAHYSEIAQDLRFIYTLAYAPNPLAPSGWRALKVQVKGQPELSIRGRSGYFKRQESEVRRHEAE